MNVVRSSALSALLLSLLLSVGPAPASGRSFSRTLTVRVPPGDVHCLYISDVGVGDQIEVAFEVVDTGTTGNLDVSASISDPEGALLAEETKVDRSAMRADASLPGDYKICVDNSYSQFSAKDVGLEMMVASASDYYYDDYIEEDLMEKMREMDKHLSDSWQLSVGEIKESLRTIRFAVRTASRLQDQMGFSYTQDMNMVESNWGKITLWSLAHLGALVATALTQVFMVKRLFDDRSFRHRIMLAAGTGGGGGGS